MFKEYDVIVLGAGHAGCEAIAVATMGSSVFVNDYQYLNSAQSKCNPE